MLKVSMPGVPLNSCNSQYNIHNISIGSKQLCAGGIERYDSCHGTDVELSKILQQI